MLEVTQAHASVHQKNFTMVQNFLIQKANISSQATFLLIYLISFSVGWEFHDSAIMERMGCKIDKLRGLFSELRRAGYVKTISIPGPKGTFSGRKRIFAAEPIFFIENQSSKAANPRPIRTSPKVGFSRCSVKPEARVKPTLNTNNKCLDNNINLSFNNNNRGDAVVGEYKEGKVKYLERLGFDRIEALKLIDKHTIVYVAAKIELLEKEMAKKVIDKPGAWLRMAIEKDYKDEPVVKPNAVSRIADETKLEIEKRNRIAKEHADRIDRQDTAARDKAMAQIGGKLHIRASKGLT